MAGIAILNSEWRMTACVNFKNKISGACSRLQVNTGQQNPAASTQQENELQRFIADLFNGGKGQQAGAHMFTHKKK